MDEAAPNAPCWNFAVELYAKSGISQACLELQDRLGVDVSFLLTVLYYARRRGIEFSAEDIASLDRSISVWRNEIIAPLRRLRRRAKGLSLPDGATDEFYQRIKADELLAEQREIGAVAHQLERRSGKVAVSEPNRNVIERVVRYFAESSRQEGHLADDAIQRAISLLHDSAR